MEALATEDPGFKKLVAEPSLDNAILREAASGDS
jgi:hypothetical protein